MSVAQTEAARKLEGYGSAINSHQVISLLMEGALERISQARYAISENNEKDATLLMEKITAIVNGLRNSLNFDGGGSIAINLEKVYDYILLRLAEVEGDERLATLDEIAALIMEVKSGWDAIKPEDNVAHAS